MRGGLLSALEARRLWWSFYMAWGLSSRQVGDSHPCFLDWRLTWCVYVNVYTFMCMCLHDCSCACRGLRSVSAASLSHSISFAEMWAPSEPGASEWPRLAGQQARGSPVGFSSPGVVDLHHFAWLFIWTWDQTQALSLIHQPSPRL